MVFSNRYICVNCGLQQDAETSPPARCLNCSDERESMTHKPQRWTTLQEMQRRYKNVFTDLGDGVAGIVTSPAFAIGPEVFLIRSSAGDVLWDCFGFLDDATVSTLAQAGGLKAIVISHPHMFGSVVEWSHALGNVPVIVHADNKPWMPRLDPVIQWWSGESCTINPAVTAFRIGGHFPGSSVLHWPEGAAGQGALFTGDGILPVEDRRWVSFMYSYPNLIPVGKRAVEKIVAAVSPLKFDRIYGGPMYGSGGGRPILQSGAKEIVLRSARRYIEHLES
ncbi:MAG TPA: MBL fold metallo-hydrolase [Candidatus Angelobacter sp.]|nr:MBL fold metallo-hydrolase [Candidatus Angelobacter sp.]